MGYYSSIKRNGLLKCATRWMNHGSILIRERRQSKKTHEVEVKKYLLNLVIKIFLFKIVLSGKVE
jgi:hypothetical protein